MVVKLNNAVLDTRKHSAVTFKEINDQNRGSLGGGEGHTDGYDKIFVSKGCDPGVKDGQICNGMRLNRTIRDLGNIEPISAQLNTKAGKVSGSPSEMLLDKSRNFKNVKFPRTFQEYNKEYKPDIVSLLETRASGDKFDRVISKIWALRVPLLPGTGGIFERLDRVIGNFAWGNGFPHYSVTHLPRLKSDHRPLLLSLRPNVNMPRGHPFRFLAG
ncbi:hypothetical protein Godav_000786 [Gossypium davidsonii]|uniref:Endonuclease/exonuclease/phosphatase domain-containing protein n=1 Tax=Gossypium davidsonii TaxID=34287 RepID=A0A7J8T2G5_GOSDV|nr:hypothetical protein [Gossypium davidsonii]